MEDMYSTMPSLYLAAIFILLILAIAWEPSRRAIGLTLVIIGGIACLTLVGCCAGIPTMFFGALLLFWK